MKKIAVVGSFVMDLVARVEAFPKAGQTIIGEDFERHFGGKGANQAVAAARLGAEVCMFGCVGNDDYGRGFLQLFKEETIDITHVKAKEDLPTALGLIQINKHAENKIVVVPGANFGYLEADLEEDLPAILDSALVVTQLELRHDITFKLIDACYNAGVPVLLNPAPAVAIADDILSKVTYLTPNETELEILTGMTLHSLEDVKEAIKILLDLGVKHVIATLGDKGALIGSKEGFKHIEGYKVEALDTVAAGDSFNGALAHGIVLAQPLEAVVKKANAVGALTVTQKGAIPSLPHAKRVSEFIEKQVLFSPE